MHNEQSIPQPLQQPAEEALAWINATQGQTFELTGLVDYPQGLTAEPDAGYDLGLVLCDGEICTREQVHVHPTEQGYQFSLVELAARDIPPLLDPPEGIRSQWLDRELTKHEFLVLLVYRGLW